MGTKVLGKDPDNLHGADTAALRELLERSSWQFFTSLMKGLKAWVCSKAHSTAAAHQSGTGWGLSAES